MEISPLILAELLICSFLFGVFMGAVNDVHRIIRVFFGVRYSKKHFDKLYARKIRIINRSVGNSAGNRTSQALLGVLIFFQDIVLFATAGVGAVILNYYFNKGEFRIYTVAALFAGFMLYYFTLGKVVMLVSEAIAFYIKAALLIVFYLFSRPFVFIWKKIYHILQKFYRFSVRVIEKKKNIRYNKREKKKILAAAREGFIRLDF